MGGGEEGLPRANLSSTHCPDAGFEIAAGKIWQTVSAEFNLLDIQLVNVVFVSQILALDDGLQGELLEGRQCSSGPFHYGRETPGTKSISSSHA